MTTRKTWLLSVAAVSATVGVVLLAPTGCESGCADDDCGVYAGTGGTGGAGGSTADGGGASGRSGSGGNGGTGGGAQCGGFASIPCADPATMYCDFPETAECGQGDATGTCMSRPESCAIAGDAVCGCDGTRYLNACEAHRAGTDDRRSGSCTAL